jgi:hypothetical protein
MSNGTHTSEVPVRSGVEPLASVSVSGPTPALQRLPADVGFMRAAWAHWKKIAHAVGVVQTRVLMVIFYFIAVLPIGLVMRLAGDPLHLKRPARGNWTPHRHQEPSVDRARQQF